MTVVSVEDFRADVDQYLAATAKGGVVLTRDGKPVAILQGIPEDAESAALAGSSEFWRMIHERRQEPGIPWEEARKQLDRAD